MKKKPEVEKPRSFKVACKVCKSEGFNNKPHYLLDFCPWCGDKNLATSPILWSGII